MAKTDYIKNDSGQGRCIRLQSELSELCRLGEFVEDFGMENGLSPGHVFKINLALDELVTNVINYGSKKGKGECVIDLCLKLDGQDLIMLMEDNAAPFDPTKAEAPDIDAKCEDRDIGGLGIHLTKKCLDDMRYERRDDKNCLYLRKNIIEKKACG